MFAECQTWSVGKEKDAPMCFGDVIPGCWAMKAGAVLGYIGALGQGDGS